METAAPTWLTFGQLAAITFISWLVIKRGNKAGDQEVSVWMAEFITIKDSLRRIELKLAEREEPSKSKAASAGHH